MTQLVALTAYPLSQDFRERFEAELGVPEYVSVPQLRRLPARALVRALASFRGRAVVLPLEDATSEALQPILHAVAALALPRSIEIVDRSLNRRRVRTRSLLVTLALLLAASAEGQLAAVRARRLLAGLLEAPRADLPFDRIDRLLYLNANLWFGLKAGGSVGHLAGVVNGFASSGHAVDLVSATDPILVSPQVQYERLEPPKAFGLPLELNFVRFQNDVTRNLSRRRDRGYGFIYQRMSVLNFGGVVLSRRLGLPLVLEYNGSEVWAARHWGRPLRYESLAQQAEDACLRHAHVVVTISEPLRNELIARGVDPARIVCYPNCVDAGTYDAGRFSESDLLDLRRRYGIADDAVVGGFIGTFGNWHGVDVLARAIARMATTDPEWLRRHKLHFLLVGDGLRMPEVRETIAAAGAERYVTLTGLVPQSDGPIHLAACDLLLSPHVPNPDGSPFFGSPTKLFEYMATGRAIAASALDQIGAVLSPGVEADALPTRGPGEEEARLAVLTTPGDEGELVGAIRFLVERPEWRATLGANARARVLERYTWRHHVAAIVERIETVAAR